MAVVPVEQPRGAISRAFGGDLLLLFEGAQWGHGLF
jgi:hypothetical protein